MSGQNERAGDCGLFAAARGGVTAVNLQLKPMETPEEMEGKGYVHWKSWQEAYQGLIDPAYLNGTMTLETCVKRAYEWPDGVLAAKDGPRVIGFAGYGPYRDDALPGTGELYALYVLKEYYGKEGAGPALLHAVLARLAGYPRVALWVLKGNARAIRFYQKHGFAPDGAEQSISLGRPATVLRMIWTRPGQGQEEAAHI